MNRGVYPQSGLLPRQMMFIDASKGLSGDMLLAAMLAALPTPDRIDFSKRLEDGAVAHGTECSVVEIEERGERGLCVSCKPVEPIVNGVAYEECFLSLSHMEKHLKTSTDTSRAILELIFEAEGKAHGLPPKEVHLHEIGRPQTILNIASIGAVSKTLLKMDPEGFTASTIITGRGIVVMSHGAVRVPPPVSEILLRGMKHAPGDVPGERATPTGIAAVKILASAQTDKAPSQGGRRCVGFGSKRFSGELGRTTLILGR